MMLQKIDIRLCLQSFPLRPQNGSASLSRSLPIEKVLLRFMIISPFPCLSTHDPLPSEEMLPLRLQIAPLSRCHRRRQNP
jgi:hypothetical protein